MRTRFQPVFVVLFMVGSACSASETAVSSAPTTTTTTTTTTVPTSSTTVLPPVGSTVSGIVGELAGLEFDDFLEQAADQLLLRSPQEMTAAGLADHFGLRNDRLDDLSDAYLLDTQVLEAGILDRLRSYDRSALNSAQQLSYDVVGAYLDEVVEGHQWMYHEYIVHQFLRSYHSNTWSYFTDTFPLDTLGDVDDYVSALWQVRAQADQVLEALRVREEMGIIPPDFVIAMARSAMLGQIQLRSPNPDSVRVTDLSLYTVLADALARLLVGEEASATILAETEAAIRDSVIPAWIALIDDLDRLAAAAPSTAGVDVLPDGTAFYDYLLRRETSTDLTPDEVHELGLAEVERIQGEMRVIFDQLGYPDGQPLEALMSRATDDAGYFRTASSAGRAEVIAAYEALLAEVEDRTDAVFDLRPQRKVVVIGDRTFGGGGGYYELGSEDGSRPGAFHTGVGGNTVAKYRMPSILYHEAVPGHHFQIGIAQDLDLPTLRKRTNFNAYVEGWALYAEFLASELGLYEDDPYGDLGRLHLELLRAVRLVTDTGIHSRGWSRQQAKDYMNEAMGEGGGRSDNEVDRYVVLPAQATGYKIGMLKILGLRRYAEEELGEDFDIKEFHSVVIGNGSLPLAVLEGLVHGYVEAAQSQTVDR